MKRWLPKVAIMASGSPGLSDDAKTFFYGRALIIEWRSFVVEIMFGRNDEVSS